MRTFKHLAHRLVLLVLPSTRAFKPATGKAWSQHARQEHEQLMAQRVQIMNVTNVTAKSVLSPVQLIATYSTTAMRTFKHLAHRLVLLVLPSTRAFKPATGKAWSQHARQEHEQLTAQRVQITNDMTATVQHPQS
uniref:Secreted protein n=1 Tax=Ciona savignyi TaxID=51511 RepID=H2YNW5_CIOSA